MPSGNRRKSAIAKLEICVTSAFASVPGLKYILIKLTPAKQTRFHVVVSTGESESKALRRIGDVRFDLFQRHAL